MNGAHWHLLINHLPVLGAPFGVCLLLASLRGSNTSLQRAGLTVLVLTALAAGLAYLRGEPAEDVLRAIGERAKEQIEPHEEMATIALIGGGLLGVGSLWGLWRMKTAMLSRNLVICFLLGGMAVSGALAYVALLGGQIRHTEIRSGTSSAGAIVPE